MRYLFKPVETIEQFMSNYYETGEFNMYQYKMLKNRGLEPVLINWQSLALCFSDKSHSDGDRMKTIRKALKMQGISNVVIGLSPDENNIDIYHSQNTGICLGSLYFDTEKKLFSRRYKLTGSKERRIKITLEDNYYDFYFTDEATDGNINSLMMVNHIVRCGAEDVSLDDFKDRIAIDSSMKDYNIGCGSNHIYITRKSDKKTVAKISRKVD